MSGLTGHQSHGSPQAHRSPQRTEAPASQQSSASSATMSATNSEATVSAGHNDRLLPTNRLDSILPAFIRSEQRHSEAQARDAELLLRPPSEAAARRSVQSSPAKVQSRRPSYIASSSPRSSVFYIDETLSDPRYPIGTNRTADTTTTTTISTTSFILDDDANISGGSRPLCDKFKAPRTPAINVDSAESPGLEPFELDLDYSNGGAHPRKVVNFDSSSCHDAFGKRISNDNLPGTPMEPNNMLDDPTPPPTAAGRRASLSKNHIAFPLAKTKSSQSTQPSTGLNDSLSGSLESCVIPMTNGGQPLKKFAFVKKASLQFAQQLSDKEHEQLENRKNSKQDKEGLDPEALMFRDGRRKIDMMLCYEEEDEGVMTEQEARRRDTRRVFLENLVQEGLELEVEHKSQSFDEKTYFVKVHLPWKTETRYVEVMNLKLPIKRFITISVKAWEKASPENQHLTRIRQWIRRFYNISDYDPVLTESEATFDAATAGGAPEEQFVVKDRCTSYTSAQRSSMVMQILLRAKFDDTEKSGIRRLINDGAFLSSFPLHEGRYDRAHSSGTIFDRRMLYLEWARPRKWYKRQPLCLIRKYFGEKIGLYFCWLGFYTQMLMWPAVVGFICFIYGVSTMESDDNVPSAEICDLNGVGNITLCPLCDKACDYQKLSNSCLFAKITYLFDNPSTVFFAIFMSFWATSFMELWKRKQTVLAWEWDLQATEADEENRPEFEATVKTFRTNPVTREKEPYMPVWSRAVRLVASGSTVLFMICVVLAAVLGTIIYRISVVAVIYGGGNDFVKQHAKIFTTITAATINLIIIMILTRIYHRIAIKLTNMENPRTLNEYEDSYTFKIFFFEFMNFYSSLIYIAFFKGRFYDHPGDDVARRSEFYRLKGDICDPAGCQSELCIQLAIVFVGKQVWNNFMEYLFPVFYNWWRQRKHKRQTVDDTHLHMAWEQDYHLQDPGRLALFDEYLEMILQYGFVTLFVAAFPLAPLFALLNNIAEIRLDAFKMVTQARRPLAERVEGIGAWYGILRVITYAAVVSNAFVIAYTSDYIPRQVYKYGYSKTASLDGYIDHSLSEFNTSDYRTEWRPRRETDPDVCQYRGYRNGPNDKDPYDLSSLYWHVFAARLAFVVAFEHAIFVFTGIMMFLIPDTPVEIKTQIQREQLIEKEAKYQSGLKKAQDTDTMEMLHSMHVQEELDLSETVASVGPVGGQKLTGSRASFMRRMSRMGDSLDAHVEIAKRQQQKRRNTESTVWEA